MKKFDPNDTKNLMNRGGVWYLRYAICGAKVKTSLHTKSLAEAQDRRDELMAKYALRDERKLAQSLLRQLAGIDEELERKAREENPGILVCRAWQRFVEAPDRRQVSSGQLGNNRRDWEKFLAWLKEHRPEIKYLRQITKQDARDFAGWLLKNCGCNATYNHAITNCGHVFRILRQCNEGLINPFEGIAARKRDDSRTRLPFTREELHAMFHSENREFARLVALGFYSALRLGSALKVRWENISDGYLHAKHDKTGADATLRIPPALQKFLDEVPPERRRGLLFPGFQEYANKKLNACFHALGIRTQEEYKTRNGKTRKGVLKGFHSLRHTAVTMALEKGASQAAVQRLAGHATLAMQEHYSHLGADVAGDVSELLGEF